MTAALPSTTASPARPGIRWPAAGLLVVTAVIHLALFPSHAGLVAEADAHPKRERTAPTPPPPPPEPVRFHRGRPEPAIVTPSLAAVSAIPYHSPAYVGWLFLLGAAVSLVAARRVLADDLVWGWTLGAAVCAAMTLALLAARTTGLPGGYSEGGSLEGHVTLAVQGCFLVVAVIRVRGERLMVRWG